MSEPSAKPKSKGAGKSMPINVDDFGVLKGKVETIERSIQNMERRLFGNGQPGIMELINRHDERLVESAKDRKDLRDSLKGLEEAVEEINAAVIRVADLQTVANDKISTSLGSMNDKITTSIGLMTANLDKSTPKWIIKNWKTLLFIIVIGFLILHAIIPADMTVWQLFDRLLKP